MPVVGVRIAVDDHGDGRLVRGANGVELAVLVIIAQLIAAAHLVFQVGIVQRPVADGAALVVVVKAHAHVLIGYVDAARDGEVLRRPAGGLGLSFAALERLQSAARHHIELARTQLRGRAVARHRVGRAHAARQHLAAVHIYVLRRRAPRRQQRGEKAERRRHGNDTPDVPAVHLFTF